MSGGRGHVDEKRAPANGRLRHDRAGANQASRIIEDVVDRAGRPRAGLVGDKLDRGAVAERKIAVDLDRVVDARRAEVEIEGRALVERKPGGGTVCERELRHPAGSKAGLQRAVDDQTAGAVADRTVAGERGAAVDEDRPGLKLRSRTERGRAVADGRSPDMVRSLAGAIELAPLRVRVRPIDPSPPRVALLTVTRAVGSAPSSVSVLPLERVVGPP